MMKKTFAVPALVLALGALAACAGDLGPTGPEVARSAFELGNPDLRIAVVGAGPSGLTAAHELVARGYHNVTVFEREDHVGGKVSSLKVGTFSTELGAVFASPDYTLTLGLADEYGVPYVAFDTPRFIYDQGVKRTFEGYLLAHYSIQDIQTAVQKYAEVLQLFPEIFHDDMTNLPPDLTLDFDAFAAKYHIEPVAELARSLIVGFGYGYYDDVPAIYELKILNMLVKIGPAGLESPPYFSFPTGFQSLWQAVAADLDVRLSSNVTRIERSPVAGGPIRVTVNGISTSEFDAVIVSAPLSAVPRFVVLTPAELALFNKVETTRYFITLFLAPGATENEAVFVQDNAVSSRINHAAVWANPGGGVPVFAAYQITDRWAPKSLITAILAYDILTLAHGVFLGPIVRKEWPDYFPRVDSAALADGFYDDVEALQGDRGLYYVGGTLSFETVETSARYARGLVDANFPVTSLVANP